MTDDSLKKYYDVLELESDASGEDINRAYKHLKNLYSKTSIATAPIDSEWNEDDKREILNEVEEAYIKLWPYAREENAENIESTERTENIENANEIPHGPAITPLEKEDLSVEPVEQVKHVEFEEYRPQEEPAVSINLDEAEPPKESPGNKAELFNSYVEEEVLFDLGTASEIGTEMEIEIDTKIDEFEIKKEEIKEETSEKEIEKKSESPSDKKIEKESEKEPGDEIKKQMEKEDTLVEQFVGGVEGQPISGLVLKKIREKLELGFPELSNSTQVPADALEAIETEAFDKLPEAGYLRYYVTNYARALAIPDPRDAADQYMRRFREWKSSAGLL